MYDSMIGEHMVRAPHCVPPEMGLDESLALLKNLCIRHLPVIRERKLVGIVSERDIKAAVNLPMGSSLTVGDVMIGDVYVASAVTPLSEVASEMAEKKMGSAIILDGRNHVVGIFTTTDALRLLADMCGSSTIGAFIDEEEDYGSLLI